MPVRSYAVGRDVGGPYSSSDPDAGWHVRSGDHSGDKLTPKKRRRSKSQWAYEATIATSARMPERPHVPRLALAFVLDKPGCNIGENATTVLTRWKTAHPGPFWLAGDMAYSNAIADKFRLPARALGARQRV